MGTTVRYLFDPLCGWCYGATPAVSSLAEVPGVTVKMLPSGLFSGQGARPMSDDFSAYAWSNDQRIARLTGQKFSERYRRLVLGDRQQRFDSGPATLALTAVSRTAPARELEALKAMQRARFEDGQNITDAQTLAAILNALGLEPAAAMLANPAADLLDANLARIKRAHELMREFSVHGVPTFIAESGTRRWTLNTGLVYANPQALISELNAG